MPSTPAIPWITDDPAVWNTVTIAGYQWPGDAWVTGKKGNRIDGKRVAGTDNETLTTLGYDPGQIGLIITIVTAAEWSAFLTLLSTFLPRKGNRPSPFEVYHPLLAVYGIRSLVMKDLPIPRKSNGTNDILEVEIRCKEFSPKKTGAVATATSSLQNINAAINLNPAVGVPSLLALPSTTETGPNLFDPVVPGLPGG